MTRILIVSNMEVLRGGMKAILEEEDGICVVGEALNEKQALRALEQDNVDIAILHDESSGIGLNVSELISQKFPAVKVVVLSMHDRPEWVMQFLNHGIKGYLLLTKGAEELIAAIHDISWGETYYSHEVLVALKQQRELNTQLSNRFNRWARKKDLRVLLQTAGIDAFWRALGHDIPVVYEEQGRMYRVKDGKQKVIGRLKVGRHILPFSEFTIE